jgi:hypothetical protein
MTIQLFLQHKGIARKCFKATFITNRNHSLDISDYFRFALFKELTMAKTKFQVPSMSIQGENVVGMIYASGSANVNVNQKVIHQATPKMEKLFKRVHKEIKTRSADPKLENQVKKIETEAAKGETADKTKLERWMKTLAKMAPDIVEVMAASLAGPVAGFTVVFKKIVERARASSAESERS